MDCHGKVVTAAILQGLSNLVAAGSVATGLDHADGLGAGLDERFEELEVVGQGVQVHFHDRDVLLGFQHVDNLAEAEAGVTLDEDGLFLKVSLGDIADEVLGVVIEPAMRQSLEVVAVTAHLLTDADQAVHTLGLEQLAHADVQFVTAIALGSQVTQDDRAGAVARATRHEVECRCQRVVVAGIAVDDDGAVVHTLDDVEACAHGRERCHAFSNDAAVNVHLQQHCQAGDGVVHVTVGSEGDGHCSWLVLEGIMQRDALVVAFSPLNLQWSITVFARPRHAHGYIALDQRSNGMGHQRVIGTIDDALAVEEDFGFLLSLLLHGGKTVVMLAAQVGDDADGGPDHRLQVVHLAGCGDARLDNGQVGVVVNLPE